MTRFPSMELAPSETRRFLRGRFARKLRADCPFEHHLAPDTPVLPDQAFLRLLQGLQITVPTEWAVAEADYVAAGPTSTEPRDLTALADAGWIRKIWGRVKVAREFRQAAARSTTASMITLKAWLDQSYTWRYQATEEIHADKELAEVVASIEVGEKSPAQFGCQTPAWVASRLWESRSGVTDADALDLRRWMDQWALLHRPTLAPTRAWRNADAEVFRNAALAVIASEPNLGNWSETRSTYVQQMVLAHGMPIDDAMRRIDEPPITLVDRAMWFNHQLIQHCVHESLDTYHDIFGLMQLLLQDVLAQDNAPAPHPTAVQLIDLAVDRAELFLGLLLQVRAHPALLVDLLIHPRTTALACLLIAQWQFPTDAWHRDLVERADQVARAEVFADAAAILGEHLAESKVPPAEIAALLCWLHRRAGPGFTDNAVDGHNGLLAILRGELAGAEHTKLRAIAEPLDGPGLQRGLGSAEFATVLDLIELGSATDALTISVVEAYVRSIRGGEYSLAAHRVGVAGATTLAQLAAQAPELRRSFLYPVQAEERLKAAASSDNPVLVAESVARSVRAHIRILCRAIIGSRHEIATDLVDALIAAIYTAASQNKEKYRVGAFAPRFEQSPGTAVLDRPLAADLGAALSTLAKTEQAKLLEAILETDEPRMLAQLLSLTPLTLHKRIQQRITALKPSNAGDIWSLTDMQARIDELLTSGATDAAAAYMEAEAALQTRGKVPGREVVRFENQLRLHYLRNEWTAILNTPQPSFSSVIDRSSAQEILERFQGIAAIKGPWPNPEKAKAIFAGLFQRRSAPIYVANWLAAEVSRLLSTDIFGVLNGADVREGRRALTEAARMLKRVPRQTALNDEVIECNRALLLLALGETTSALTVVTSIRPVRLQVTVAAYRSVALARLDRYIEAIAVLDAAEHDHGRTALLAAARGHIMSGSSFPSAPDTAFQSEMFRDLAAAVARFKSMSPADQARVLNPDTSAFDGLVIESVRAAADSVVSLVPIMKEVPLDRSEDDLTAFIQQVLAARIHFFNWSVHDHSRSGYSANTNPGEPDLRVMWGNTTLAIIEAVVCARPLSQDSMRADLESHFQKLLGYGTPRLFFHLTYAHIDELTSLMSHLEAMSKDIAPPGFAFKGRDPITHTDSRPPGFVARYDGDFGELKVVFLVLNIGQRRQQQAAKVAAATRRRKARRAKDNNTREALQK